MSKGGAGQHYQGLEMAVESLELRADEGERLGRRDEGGVVLHRHLLHLPPHPLRVDPQQLRLLPTAHRKRHGITATANQFRGLAKRG